MEVHVHIMRPFGRGGGGACPIAAASVPAGFPSPADDYLEDRLDLNSHLIRHPAATFFVRADGDSMRDAGIHHGDILIVDRALEPSDGNVIIAVIDGDLTVKRLSRRDGGLYLVPDNRDYRPMRVGEDADFHVWGVVTAVIHMLAD